MKLKFASFLRANPDIVALALLLAVCLPMSAVARPKLHLTFASDQQHERVLNKLEERGQRVWQRLEDRMRRFEEKFDKMSMPRTKSTYCDGVESD
ncbi:hypothetical protein [uncultured Paludibaculum sp.]|uniref:hypothetical protein n=1 Tax=uncultured Paludibaculum sp. TaxID=1765020 RepID=UPI002AAAEBD9|nr:hypothetical protein [uncultured Paludibaculum sp.]